MKRHDAKFCHVTQYHVPVVNGFWNRSFGANQANPRRGSEINPRPQGANLRAWIEPGPSPVASVSQVGILLLCWMQSNAGRAAEMRCERRIPFPPQR